MYTCILKGYLYTRIFSDTGASQGLRRAMFLLIPEVEVETEAPVHL